MVCLRASLDKIGEAVQRFVNLRRPGYSRSTTKRREPDEVVWLSGLTDEGRTLGSPIAFVIQNRDARSQDYATARSELFWQAL